MLGQSPVFTQPDLPLQIYHLQDEGITCTCVEADPELGSLVYYYWLMRVQAESIDLKVIPDNATDLVLSPDIDGFAALYTPVARPFLIPIQGPVRFFGACLNTESVTGFFGRPLTSLAVLPSGDETVHALGAADLCDVASQIENEADLKRCLDGWFTSRLAERQGASPEASGSTGTDVQLLEMLSESLDAEGLKSVTSALGVSERQFRRLSSDLIGLSPKKAQRVVRLQRALRELLDSASLSASDHFFDEAHYIRELRTLTGLTPGKIRKLAEKYNSPN